MLQNSKYKKEFKFKFKTYKFNDLKNGVLGIRVLESCRLTTKQLESIRRVFVRLTKRTGKFWLRVFLNKRLTKKSKGSRMGKGIGSFDTSVIDVKAGQVLLEFSHLDEKTLSSFIAGIKSKIPSKIEFIYRDIFYKNVK